MNPGTRSAAKAKNNDFRILAFQCKVNGFRRLVSSANVL